MTIKNHDIVTIDVTLRHETEKAWLVESHITGKKAWVAKSVGELDIGVDNEPFTLQLPEWIAEEKELI